MRYDLRSLPREKSNMKFIIITLLGCLLAFSVTANQAPEIKKPYQADKVADGVYVIHGPLETPNPGNQGFMNNPGFLLTNEGVVVVDPGGSVQTGEMVVKAIAGITDKPVIAVFNTHVHGDHWLGNDAIKRHFPDVKIYAHPTMISKVEKGAGDDWMIMAMRMTEGAVAGTKIVNATTPVDDGDSIEIGGLTFNIFHNGPAHTFSDIMIHVPEKRVMFLGDNASVNRLVRNEGSVKGNIAALDNAIATETDLFVPGHGPSSKDSAEIYANYLKFMYKKVREKYDDGMSDFEIRPAILASLKPWQSWSDFDRLTGKHIHSIYLEIENDEF